MRVIELKQRFVMPSDRETRLVFDLWNRHLAQLPADARAAIEPGWLAQRLVNVLEPAAELRLAERPETLRLAYAPGRERHAQPAARTARREPRTDRSSRRAMEAAIEDRLWALSLEGPQGLPESP